MTARNDVDQTQGVKLTHINAWSVANKPNKISEYVKDKEIDVLTITDTWLKKTGDKSIIANLAPEGFKFHMESCKPNPWYNDEIEEARCLRRRCEALWRKSKL